MIRYRMFSEWREIEAIGTDLADALRRRGSLREPARYERGVQVDPGAVREIAGARPLTSDPQRTRGGHPFARALVEFEGGEIREVHARIEEEYA